MVASERSMAMKRTRRNHEAAFKAQMVLTACKGDQTLAELAEHFGVHPTQITEWKRHLLERVADVFGGPTHKPDAPDLTVLHAKIGKLALQNNFLEGALTKAGLLSARR
jgi:transposase